MANLLRPWPVCVRTLATVFCFWSPRRLVACPAFARATRNRVRSRAARWLLLGVTASWLASASPAAAQLPVAQLFALSPMGGQQGTTVQTTITASANFEGVDRLLFSHPGITAAPKMADLKPFEKTPEVVPLTFLVTIAADTPPGVYDMRAAGRFGISNPRSFVVGDRKEAPETPGNNTRATAQAIELESTVNGASDGAAYDWYKIAAKQGQRLIVDCWAQRIDSRMDATLALYDPTGRQVALDRDTNGRDPLLDYAIPADGEYLLQVYDFVYAGGPEYCYRLSVGTGPYIDLVVPPTGMPGARGEHVVYGRNLPGGVPAPEAMVNGKQLDKVTVGIDFPANPLSLARLGFGHALPSASTIDGFEFRLPSPVGASNSFVLTTATAPAIVEQEPNDAVAQRVTVPCEYVGTFGPRNDQDWIAFDAKQGEAYWVEAFSQRLGLPTDPHVLIQRVVKDDKGQEQYTDVADLEDTPLLLSPTNGDPAFRFQSPADGTYRILIEDLQSHRQADARLFYRLAIRKEVPDFRLAATSPFPIVGRAEQRPWAPLVRRGGNEPIDVYAIRTDGFNGEIKITAEGLPAGVTCKESTIGSGQSIGTLVLSATDDAAAFTGPIRIVGKAKIAEQEVAREAISAAVLVAAAPNTPVKSRLARDVVIGVSGHELTPFQVAAGGDQPLEISRGGKLAIPVKLTRRGEIKGNVAFTVLDLPPNTAPDALAFDPNTNEGNLGLMINAGAPVGTYTISLQSQTTIGYKYDVRGAELAAAAKTEFDAVVTALTTASQAADVAKQAADAAATQTATEAQAAAEKATQAKAASDGDANNADLKKASDEAAAASATAADKAKVAAEAKVAADKAAADAAALLKMATDFKAVVDKRAADTAAAAQPKDLAIVQSSTPITFTIKPTPVNVVVGAQPAFKQGTKIELPFTVERKYGFADAVQVEVLLPGGATGVVTANISVPAGQNEGKLAFDANAEAAVGEHAVRLRTTVTFNGQGVQFEQTFPLKVESK